MVQRIHNVNRWVSLEEGRVIGFPNPKPRTVRLEVNSPGDSEIYYVSDDGEAKFLALVRGRDLIEFTSGGSFSISVTGNDCWFYTADGETVHTEVIDPIVFTRITERKARNPELVAIEMRMMQNMNARLERMAREYTIGEQRRERLRAHKEERAAAAALERLAAQSGEDPDAGDEPLDDDGASEGRRKSAP